MNWNPVQAIFEQSRRTPERLALFADGIELCYADLTRNAARLATALREQGIGRGSRVGILASRNLIAIEAVLAVAWCGAAYVPLGQRWPKERLKTVLSLIMPDAIIADDKGTELLADIPLATTRTLILPDDERARTHSGAANQTIRSMESLPDFQEALPPAVMSAEDIAYVIFTSGTTGVPKGVVVACSSVAAYLTALAARKAMTPEDRASQFTELSFDPSLGEIFVPLSCGASLHVVPPVQFTSPARFIRERQLTIWGSTPAAIAWMRDTRSLQPGSLSNLRYSSFGGEPLPMSLVDAWRAAAPHSVIDNLYGPTEATVDCAGQYVEPGVKPVVTAKRGVLAIGIPHPGSELAVLGPDHHILSTGEVGELAIAGRQLTVGYLDDSAMTAERFPIIGGKRWYLTGDLAMKDAAGMFHHMGRMDNQIKIQGYRVELEEIEAHLRTFAKTDQVAAVAWPMEDGVARSIIGFVANSNIPVSRLRDALRSRLPPYMVPSVIKEMTALPQNSTGKLDRRALIALLEADKNTGDAAKE
jgi:amino acid adenylation domain-containing protein